MTIGSEETVVSEFSVKGQSFTRAMTHLRGCWICMFIISILVVTPCLWHVCLGSGDLCSHVYNAWIAQLIKNGQAPGLWLAKQGSNVLFDFVVSGLGNIFNLAVAGKIATCVAVLIYFWGGFALIWAVNRRFPWFSIPCLAMFSYGWTFEMGFMNYYIAVGMAFFGLAILVGGRGWSRMWVVALLPLIWLAHPLGVALLLVAGSYIIIAERLTLRHRTYMFGGATLLLIVISSLLKIRYSRGAIWNASPQIVHDGIDQLLLYGPQYLLPAWLFLVFASICFAVDLLRVRCEPRWWFSYLLPLELFVFALLTALLFPSFIDIGRLHQIGFNSIGFLKERLTSVSAVFLCCVLGAMKPEKWHFAGFCFINIIFFFFLYRDTATLNEMEAEVRRCVNTVAPGQRVLGTIHNFKGSRVSVHGILDTACIGRCFDYGNYEAASQQFRVRALPENSLVLANFGDCQAAATGKYIVRASDLPLYQIENCGSNMVKMNIRALEPGETNGCTPYK